MDPQPRRWPRIAVGIALAVAGSFCLNDTKGFGIDHGLGVGRGRRSSPHG